MLVILKLLLVSVLFSLVVVDEFTGISGNNFTGIVSNSEGNLESLKVVNLSSNLFHGSLPESFRNCVDVGHNLFSGDLPWYGATHTNKLNNNAKTMQAVMKNLVSDMEREEEMTTVFKRFGDAQSMLLDQYERMSFEVQLNQAMLGRSLSEPAVKRRQAPLPLPPPLVGKPVKQGKRGRGSGFQKVIKKLFGPILGKKGEKKDGFSSDRKDSLLKAFSKSLRVRTID